MRRSGSLNQCYFCECHFAGPRPYGMHFDPVTAECLTPDAMRAAGLRLNAAGFWVVHVSRPIDSRTHTQEVSA
jgi:hypothetical protein